MVYVGQSVDLLGRLGEHAEWTRIDARAFIERDSEDLDEGEAYHIRLLEPRMNGRYRGGKLTVRVRTRAQREASARVAAEREAEERARPGGG